MGTLSLKDIGQSPVPGGEWAVRLNNLSSVWVYSGEGQAYIAIDASGKITINGVSPT